MGDLLEVGTVSNRDLYLFLSELHCSVLQCPLFESADPEHVFTQIADMLDWETVGYHNHISCWRYNLALTSEHLPQGSWIASCLCIREVNFEVCFDSYLQFLTTVKRMASTLNKTALLLKQPERQVCIVLTFSTLVLFEDTNFIIIVMWLYEWQNGCFSIVWRKRWNSKAFFSYIGHECPLHLFFIYYWSPWVK